MARSLPLFINVDSENLTSSTSESSAAAINKDNNAIGGCQIVGVFGQLASTGGKITVRVYDDASKTREKYNVELDFTSVTQTTDTQSPPIPFIDTPYWTATADATADTKIFALVFYVQAISVM